MVSILDWIDVGEVSAERDANLSSYFYDAGVSKRIISNPKQYLLLGRKGAGKTAVFLHLVSKPGQLFSTKDIVVGLSLQSYNWIAHDLLGDTRKHGGFQHRDSWRFVLYVEAIRAIVEKLHAQSAPVPPTIEKASKVLESLFSKPTPSWIDLLGDKLYSLASVELPGFDLDCGIPSGTLGSVSFEEVKERNDLRATLNRNIGNLTAWLEKCLGDIPKGYRVFLIFDRLDEAWVPSFVEQSKTIISGLLHASEHAINQFHGNIRPIIFLREDIFWTFDINDRNKLREDCSDSLKWTPDSIEKLILERINHYADKNNGTPIASLQDIFEEKEMRSRTPPSKHIFNRTMCRPRDMVAFTRRVIESARAESLSSDNSGKILAKSVYIAEPGYSDYLYDELSDEWRNQNPLFLQYLGILENLRYAIFPSENLEKSLLEKGLAQDRAGVRAIFRFLFENSILGITVGESNQWRYKCFYPNQGFTDAQFLKVHPGLIKRLGLTEGTASGLDDPSQV